MNYNIAVCDDSDKDRELNADIVEKWASAHNYQISLEKFASAESFLFRYDEKNDFDILLLDVEMGEVDGVSMAKKIRRSNETLQIIFITGYSDYISDGYDVAALHYLVKPVHAEKLFAVLDRAAEKLRKNEKILSFELDDEMIRVPVYKIRYADVMGNYVTIHAADDVTVRMTLADLEKDLDDRFFRVGRSVIVNLTKISRVSKNEIKLDDGSTIPIPRRAYESVNRAIIDRI